MSAMDSFPEDDKRWLMHVGYLAQSWAALEQTLDGIVRQLHATHGGHKFEPEPPQAFKRKRTLIRRAFAAHPDLTAYSDRINELMDEATRLSAIRHWALHSGVGEFNSSTAVLFRYSLSEPFKWERQKLTVEQIFDAAKDCAGLNLTLVLASQRWFNLRTKEELEEFIREILSQSVTRLPSDEAAG